MKKKVSYDVAVDSIIGTREEQQDACYYEKDDKYCFIAVCDGMGGLAGGADASKMVIHALAQLHERKEETQSYDTFYMNAVDIVDESVHALRKRYTEQVSIGTTLVSAALWENQLYWLSVGDSRLYLQRGDELICVTRDHNYFLILNEALKSGDISQKQYEIEKEKGEYLISYIGMGGISVMDINTIPVPLQNNDIVMLVSDGIYRSLSDCELLECMKNHRSAQGIIKEMIKRIRKKEKADQDNATIVVAKIKIEE